MKSRKEVAELAAILAPRGNGNAYHTAEATMLLCRMGSAATTIATNLCNVPNYQSTFEKRKASILKRLELTAKAYGVRFEIDGDPRGYVLRMFGNDNEPIRGNSFSTEDGYGI